MASQGAANTAIAQALSVSPASVANWRARFAEEGDLIASIEEYLDAHNEDPRPSIWTAKAESILAKIARGRTALEKVS
jgi:transposase